MQVRREYEKRIRGLIRGYIHITKERLHAIHLHVFQRLRRVSQLSFADIAYPNATHLGFGHSVGALHLGRTANCYLTESGEGGI